MPCDTQTFKEQTMSERIEEVRRTITQVSSLLARGKIKAVVGPQGAIAFVGLSNEDRNRVTDACIYRRIMSTGSAAAKAAIMRAELLAGRSVNKQVVAQGVHSHNGGASWHSKG
jgi:hypothetical protein